MNKSLMNSLKNSGLKEIILKEFEDYESITGSEIVFSVGNSLSSYSILNPEINKISFVFKKTRANKMNLRDYEQHLDLFGFKVRGFNIFKFYDFLFDSNLIAIEMLQSGDIFLNKIIDKDGLLKIISKNFDRRKYINSNYEFCKVSFEKYFFDEIVGQPDLSKYVSCIESIIKAKYCLKTCELPSSGIQSIAENILNSSDLDDFRQIILMSRTDTVSNKFISPKWFSFIRSSINEWELNKHNIRVNQNKADYFDELNKHLIMNI